MLMLAETCGSTWMVTLRGSEAGHGAAKVTSAPSPAAAAAARAPAHGGLQETAPAPVRKPAPGRMRSKPPTGSSVLGLEMD